jgi:hypothetical protein
VHCTDKKAVNPRPLRVASRLSCGLILCSLVACASPPATRASQRVAPWSPLPAPVAVRTPQELRLQAAQRIMQANPTGTYTGAVPAVLLAIPVLEVELKANGHIRRIQVLRYPSQAKDTTEMAIAAVRRSAPFGDVSHMPKPWKFTETFLFNDVRQFKPRTLDM